MGLLEGFWEVMERVWVPWGWVREVALELIREMFPLRDARLGAQIGDRGGFATPWHDPIR